MQTATAPSVDLTTPPSSLMVDLSGRRAPPVIGALLTPAAMLAGAVGLAIAWAAAAHAPLPAASRTLAAASPSPTAAAQAGLQDSRALDRLLGELGSPVQLVRPPAIQLTATAAQAVTELKTAEADMVTAADQAAQARLKTLRAAFRATGLDARPYMAADAAKPAQTPKLSPLELRDAGVLAARLDIDTGLARQVQRAARDLMAAQALGQALAAMPLATPVDDPVRSSPFGTRTDPFTHEAAFHPGQDFSGRYGTAIHVTAPGVVSFVGQRSGYGDCVEVDHGYGFKTRYGHLSGFVVGIGTAVKTGDVIGRMGSTGRSTGVHLHYEVWANGRLLNPAPFLKAGAETVRG